ncbi:hypothetical protein [Streptomyces sp. N35]|uniref:hypothetical protein n=1 Tax=Streptomyces sp. N35 TaxID=2795730 RepID=UPI0018F75062|nr:hypothetical protein [Streptomyces sp. N35]
MSHADLEEELAAAMLDRTERVPARRYDADAVVSTVRRRRRRLRLGTAAAVAAVALGAGFVSQSGPGRAGAPVQATTAPSTDSRPTGAPAQPDPTPAAAPSQPLPTLFLSALRHQNPATRAEVDPDAVATLFADRATYERVWGTDSLGVTCGEAVDGVLAAGEVSLYQGTRRVDRTVSLEFDPGTGRVTGLTCRPVAGHGKGGDPTVSGFYGGLVEAAESGAGATRRKQLEQQFVSEYLRAVRGPNPATCFSHEPRFWLADDATSATLTHGWTVTFGDDDGFPIDIDENGKIARSCGG